MPYTLPTASEFKTRFSPVFDDVGDLRIEAVMAEAARMVDESWEEADYQPAINYATAHGLVMEGVITSVAALTTAGRIKSRSLGDASTTYESSGSSAPGTDSWFASTIYGQQFIRLRRVNRRGPVVV